MTDLVRNLLLLAIAGAAVTVLGSAAALWRNEDRRLNRFMKRALGAPPDLMIKAEGRGLAAGLNAGRGVVAVLWDGGLRGLIYRTDQVVGAELIVDDRVEARAYRGEPRRALDQLPSDARRVLLRLVFDNARDPDFELPLWPPADAAKVQRGSAFDALQSARRWVSSVEAILRQTPAAEPARVQAPAAAELPWDDDEDDGGESEP